MDEVSRSELDRERHPVELCAQLDGVALVFLPNLNSSDAAVARSTRSARALGLSREETRWSCSPSDAERFAARREDTGA